MLIDILNKRRIETRLHEIMADANKSIVAFRERQFKELYLPVKPSELHHILKVLE